MYDDDAYDYEDHRRDPWWVRTPKVLLIIIGAWLLAVVVAATALETQKQKLIPRIDMIAEFQEEIDKQNAK